MKKLLIVVDYQNDFVTGSLGFPKAKELERRICEKIQACRENGDEVVFTFDTHTEDYLNTQEGKNLPVPHCVSGTDGWRLYGSVAALREEGDRQFKKPCFGSAELFDYLRGREWESVELVGLVSNICVISNAVLAKTALPEVPVLVDAACTASYDEELNRKALDILEGLQVIVTNRK
ncbi:MAG: cysteine hydrolase [Clostridiales bacterium]|jgi:nicotinamidase-related amidase|nr:cysteine hydrolase [Clostridiales bacterium]